MVARWTRGVGLVLIGESSLACSHFPPESPDVEAHALEPVVKVGHFDAEGLRHRLEVAPGVQEEAVEVRAVELAVEVPEITAGEEVAGEKGGWTRGPDAPRGQQQVDVLHARARHEHPSDRRLELPR